MTAVIETQRLMLRRFTTDDTAFIIEIVNSPGWLKFIGDRNIKSSDDARKYLLNGPLKSYAEHGFGLWMVNEKMTSAPVGMCGFLKRETLDNPDVGFAFLPQHTGKGYAKESVLGCLSYFKNTFDFAQVDAITTVDNAASQRVLQIAGFSFNKVIQNDRKEALNLYSINLF